MLFGANNAKKHIIYQLITGSWKTRNFKVQGDEYLKLSMKAAVGSSNFYRSYPHTSTKMKWLL